MSINFSDRWKIKWPNFNLPKNSLTIEVCYQSENRSLCKSNMPQKIQAFLFYPGFLGEGLRYLKLKLFKNKLSYKNSSQINGKIFLLNFTKKPCV